MSFKFTLLAISVLSAMGSCANAEPIHYQSSDIVSGNLEASENFVPGSSGSLNSILVTGEDTNVSLLGQRISASMTVNSSWNSENSWFTFSGITAGSMKGENAGTLILGGDQTQSIQIDVNVNGTGLDSEGNTQGLGAVGLWGLNNYQKEQTNNGGNIVVNSDNLKITVHSERGSAYGILAQNSTTKTTADTPSTVTVNADNTTIIATSGVEGAAAALVALSQGRLTVNGNLYAKGDKALVARGDAVVKINESESKTVKLIGDIDFNYDKKTSGTGTNAEVLVNLSNAESFWKGSATVSYGTGKPSDQEKLSVKNFQLGLSNGAQWNPTVVEETAGETTGTTQLAVNKLTFNDGIINLQTAGQTVEIQNMSGTGGTLNIATSKTNTGFETAKLTVDSIGEGSNPTLTMNFSGITADHISNAEEELGTLADQSLDVSSGQNVAQVRTVSEGNIRGAITQNVDETGATSTHQAKNVKLTDYGALNSMTFVQWRNEINHLTKRLGDIRASESSIGAWARVYGGESQWKSNSEIEMDHTTIQVGADYRINNHWIVGGAFSYTDSDADLVKGQAKGDSYSLAAYATYMADGGSYLDLIARYGYLDNEMTSGNMSVDTKSNAFSLSVETGHMFRIMEQAYIEPQIEVTYGFISGDDTTASNDVRLDQDDFQSLITRVGVRTGFEFPEKAGTIYAMLSYSYDFLGDADGTASQGGLREALNEDLGGGWVSYGIGAQFKLGDNAFAYGELERTSGGEIDNPYLFNVGFRWNF